MHVGIGQIHFAKVTWKNFRVIVNYMAEDDLEIFSKKIASF